MNIREYYKSLNNGGKSRIGLSILQLKLFSKQVQLPPHDHTSLCKYIASKYLYSFYFFTKLFQALEHVHKCGYIHADIKVMLRFFSCCQNVKFHQCFFVFIFNCCLAG